jgi:hypothetical protein
MKRRIVLFVLVGLALTNVGCLEPCRRLFGLDRRCDAPPPGYYSAPPMVTGPAVQYAPAPGCAK